MNIFLRRIPANTKHIEISEFVTPVLRRGFFRRPGRIIDIEILALRDMRTDTIEYHGLVTLDSEGAAQRAVSGLKNRRLNGRYVLVRPYYHRSWYNDPRQNQDGDDTSFIEKRRGDRRRGNYLEVIKNISDRFNSEDDFFKTVSHRQFQVTFIVPSEVEMAVAECIVDYELAQQNQRGPGEKLKHHITRFITEQEGPERNSRRFQIYAEKQDITALLEMLKHQLPDSGIHYWVMPVVESGII